ncbi:MAG: hypothetical protein LBL23_09230 [Coriobacteriales bacterium]|jgi:hypothetical protein|nr:hypothetical protein [Coriobacteriales bacterium]
MEISYTDWDKVASLPIVDKVEIMAAVPRTMDSATRIWLARTQENPIPPLAWSQILDPSLDNSAKNLYVESYFTVCVFELRWVDHLSIPIGQTNEKIVKLSHESKVRSSYSTKLFIENVIEGGLSGGEQLKFNVKERLTTAYTVETLSEYSQTKSDSEQVTVSYKASPEDRTIVWWDLTKVIGLYRQSTENTVTLIGLGDYLTQTVAVTYDKNGIVAADSPTKPLVETTNKSN